MAAGWAQDKLGSPTPAALAAAQGWASGNTFTLPSLTVRLAAVAA